MMEYENDHLASSRKLKEIRSVKKPVDEALIMA
jgi:hypothetical protein